MSDITKIKIDNERERSYKDFPANREFKKRAEDDNPGGGWPSDLHLPSDGGYGYTEDETIHQIDEKYIPESGRWPADLPKPSADGYGWVEENKGVTIVDGTFHDAAILTSDYALVEGQTYDVTFNGTEYNDLIAFDDYGYITIGAPFPDYTVYPFCISSDTDGIHLYTEADADYTILITTGRSETIHKIDEKYLPESCCWPSDLHLPSDGGYGYTEDETIHQIDEKYLPASGNDPDLVFVINKHFDGELSKTDVSIATGTIADFVEKMEDGNAKCVVRYHNVSEPGTAVTYGEITNVMVERYETGVYFYYLYAGGGYGISVVMIECNTNGTIVNVFKQGV